MLILAAIAISLGVVLGLKFKVLALVPAITLGLLAIVAQGTAQGDSLWHVLLAAAFVVTGLQVGYVVGLFAREGVLSRSSRHRPAWLQPDHTLTKSGS